MSMIRGDGSGAASTPHRDAAILSEQDQKRLASIALQVNEEMGSKFLQSHRDTDDLRYVADRYRRRHRIKNASSVSFEYDEESGKILVKITDELTGGLRLKISPEQVEAILQTLEETEDNDVSLTSFFIDVGR